MFVNWGHFTEIDEFRLSELSPSLHDLWLPPADDIDLFDDTLTWLLNVSYIGKLGVWRSWGCPACC